MLRAASHGPVRILLPMVSNTSEVMKARELLQKAAKRLKRRKIAVPDPLPPLGIMIEVPGAALAADALARESDFFAIGSNDLTQELLAVDRGNARVADLYQALHPAVLAALSDIIDAAHQRDKSVSICGELAGDPRAAPLLVAMGFDQLSMNAGSLSVIKRVLSAFSRDELAKLIATLRPLRSAQEVVSTLDQALSDRGLDIFLRRGSAV